MKIILTSHMQYIPYNGSHPTPGVSGSEPKPPSRRTRIHIKPHRRKSQPWFWFFAGRQSFAFTLLLSILTLPGTINGQTEVIYDFNSGNDVGWGHYNPGAGFGQ